MLRIATIAIVFAAIAKCCTAQSDSNVGGTFVFSLDLLQGASGYFHVEGYDGIQPELTMVRGMTYTFDQLNSTNWYHPLGFAYYPDGAHKGVDELEEGVGNGDAPVYYINGALSDLDTYEPEFYFPEDTWTESNYTVELTVTDENVTEIFYFCHIHNNMSGRINIVDAEGDEPADTSIDLYEPYEASAFDEECGTYEADLYEPKEGTFESALCPDQNFLCGDVTDSFDRCMHAIDCKMNYEMRIERENDESNTIAFMQQMIPHHENAVNMARILLKNPGEELDDEVSAMLREIVNAQNSQITYMKSYLDEVGAQRQGDVCDNPDADDGDVPGYAIGIITVLGLACIGLLCAMAFTYRSKRGKQVGNAHATKS